MFTGIAARFPIAHRGGSEGVPFWGGAGFMVAGAIVCALGLPRRAAAVAPQPAVRERDIV